MLDPRYRIREYSSQDFAANVAILNRITPDRPITVAELERYDTFSHTPPMLCRQFAVDELSTGQLVAAGGMATPPDSIGQGTFWAGAAVDPDHQGKGIGQELARVLEAEAVKLGAVRLWASALSAQTRSVRFLEQQGYREKLRNGESRLALDRAPSPAPTTGSLPRPEGVVFTTLAAEGANDPQVIDRVYALVAATFGDAPRMGAYVPPTRAQVGSLLMQPPALYPEAFFLARAGERYVGMSNLQRIELEPETLHLIFTATLPEFRRRGIASGLKRLGIQFARAHGYRHLRTDNDSLNRAIWSINERQGYTREREMLLAEKQLIPGAP
ncbi:MAG: GNAT family N-acetyltransferase [Thermoplasmata archaeon]|nr:GNAT family N-acetyltransferase [Thermoplasmata archaeon]